MTAAGLRRRVRALDPVGRDVALLCAAFAALGLTAVLLHPPIRSPDSATYFAIDFLGHANRLWTVPVVYSALPNLDEGQTALQQWEELIAARTIPADV